MCLALSLTILSTAVGKVCRQIQSILLKLKIKTFSERHVLGSMSFKCLQCLYCSVVTYTNNPQYLCLGGCWKILLMQFSFLKKSSGSDFYPNLFLYSTEKNVSFQELLQGNMGNTFDGEQETKLEVEVYTVSTYI